MRRGRLILNLALATAAGCADPTTTLLKAGQRVTVFDPDGVEVVLNVASRRDDGIEVLEAVRVPSGTGAIVVDDKPAISPVRADLRLVTVRIDEGEHRGVEGGLNRQELRP